MSTFPAATLSATWFKHLYPNQFVLWVRWCPSQCVFKFYEVVVHWSHEGYILFSGLWVHTPLFAILWHAKASVTIASAGMIMLDARSSMG